MICPNINSKEWKTLVAQNKGDVKEALKQWMVNNPSLSESAVFISEKTNFIVERLKENFENVQIVYDKDLEVSGKVIKTDEGISLIINPSKMEDDTVAHEFGHIFIDSIGGLNNSVVQDILNEVKDTARAKEIRELYKDSSIEVQNKEIVIDLLGKEVTNQLSQELENPNKLIKLLRGLLNQISEFFGFDNNKIKSLAKEMIKTKFTQTDMVLEELEYNQKQPYTDQEKSKKAAIDKIVQTIDFKIKELSNYATLKGQDVSEVDLIQRFEDVLKTLKTAEADTAIIDFLKLGEFNTKQVLDKVEKLKAEGDISLEKLYRIKNYIDSFGPSLTDTIGEVFDDLSSEERQKLNSIRVNFKEVEDNYHRLGLIAIKSKINPTFPGIYAFYRRQAKIAFAEYAITQGINKKSKEDYAKEEEAFIEKYLKDNGEKIAEEVSNKANKFLTTIDRDLSIFDYWATNPRDLNSDIIQEAIKILDEADYTTAQESDNYLITSKYYYDRYIAFVGKKSNQEELYAPILKKDENGKVLPELLNNATELESKYKGTVVEELLNFLIESAEFRDSNIPKKFRLGLRLPMVEKTNLERLYEVGPIAMLKGAIGDQVKVRGEDTETGNAEQEVLLKEGENFLDKTIKVMSNSAGKEKQFIPIHYRNSNISREEMSFDVMSLFVVDMNQAFNYKNKMDVQATLMVMQDLLSRKSAKVNQTYGLNKLKKVVFGDEGFDVQKDASESLVYKALEDLIQVRLFGIRVKSDPRVTKVVKTLKNYVSLSLLTNNWISGAANYIQGTTINIIKASGGTDFTFDDFVKAKIKVSKDLVEIGKDVANFHHKSKTNLLLRKLQVRSDFTPLMNKFSEDNLLKRKATPFSFLLYNELAEFNIQAANMYAVLGNLKVKDKEGNYVDVNGNKVDKDKAASIDEVFEISYSKVSAPGVQGETITEEEYNKLSLKEQEGYAKADLKLKSFVGSADKVGELSDNNLKKLSLRLREINRSSFGNYDGNNRAAIDRTAPGILITHMRQWFVTLLKDRTLGGFSLFTIQKNEKGRNRLKFISRKNLRPDDIKYNENIDSLQEGFYVTTLRFLGESITKMNFNLIATDWRSLDDYEKANIRKGITELAMTLSFVVAGKILANMKAEADDEDEKRKLLIASILTNRAAAELMTFYNPMEWQKVMRSPAVSLGVVANLSKALKQIITEPTEEFVRGQNKGENKAKVYFLRSTPFKSMYRNLDDIHNWLTQ
jgi:hypothetical protein